MWTYNDYYADLIIVFPTHKKTQTSIQINNFKIDGSEKSYQTRLVASDGKLIQGDIPITHLWSQTVTT